MAIAANQSFGYEGVTFTQFDTFCIVDIPGIELIKKDEQQAKALRTINQVQHARLSHVVDLDSVSYSLGKIQQGTGLQFGPGQRSHIISGQTTPLLSGQTTPLLSDGTTSPWDNRQECMDSMVTISRILRGKANVRRSTRLVEKQNGHRSSTKVSGRQSAIDSAYCNRSSLNKRGGIHKKHDAVSQPTRYRTRSGRYSKPPERYMP